MVAKENQKTTSDFDALEPRKRGCSPLLTPKKWAAPKKTEDSTPVRREDLLTVFFGSADLKPLSRCATAPPGSKDVRRKRRASVGSGAANAVFLYDLSCEKCNAGASADAPALLYLKYSFR